MESPARIERLYFLPIPSELQAIVFSFLDPSSLVRLSWVSKDINQIVPYLIRRVHSLQFPIPEDVLPFLDWLAQHANPGCNLAELTLQRGLKDHLPQIFDSLSTPCFTQSLKTLHLVGIENMKCTVDLSSLHSLRRLYIRSAPGAVTGFHKLTALEDLHLRAYGVPKPSKWLHFLSKLQTLVLHFAEQSIDADASLAGLESSASTLQTLRIYNNGVVSSSLYRDIAKCTKLMRLSISIKRDTVEKHCDSLPAIASLTRLQQLHFQCLPINSTMIRSLSALNRLSQLKVDESLSLGSEGLQAIVQTFPLLEQLNITRSKVPTGAFIFLKELSRLKQLDCTNTSIKRRDVLGCMPTVNVIGKKETRHARMNEELRFINRGVPHREIDYHSILAVVKKRHARALEREALLNGLHQCENCRMPEQERGQFGRCGRCKTVFYCSRSCQATDWYGHKDRCKPHSSIK